MAKLGFSIGRGINLAAKFAGGAGMLDTKSGLLDTAKSMVGMGSNVQAGAGASLSDRVRGGLSAISPTFAKGENIRSMIDARAAGIKSQGITDELNQSKLDDIRQNAIDKETQFDPNSILPDELKDIPRLQEGMTDLLKAADLDGKNGTSVAEFKAFKEKGEADGSFQRTMINFMDTQVKATDTNLKTLNTNIQPLIDKMNTSDVGVVATPGSKGFTSLDDIREMLKDPQMAGTVDKKLAEQVMAMDKMEQQKQMLTRGKNAAIASMSTQQALQLAQTEKLAREAADLTADQFESTKTIESIARAQHNKPYAELTQAQQRDVMESRLKQDPERLKIAFQMKKQFDGIEGIKNYKKVQVNSDIMENTIERVLSGAAESNLATDQTLVNTLNKIMDPSSVVRESEFERTGQGVALRNKLKAWVNQVVKGGVRLRDEDRQELVDQARVMMASHKKYAQAEADRIGPLAKSGGIDPILITGLEFQGGQVDQDNVNAFMNK